MENIKAEVNGIKFNIKETISLGEVIALVKGASENCFVDLEDDEDSFGATYTYEPEIQEFCLWFYIIKYFTDIELPESDSEKYEFILDNIGIISEIKEAVDSNQLKWISDGFNARVKYLADARVEASTREINELTKAFRELSEQASKMVEGLDAGQFAEAIKKVSESEIDEEKIVQAVLAHQQKEE